MSEKKPKPAWADGPTPQTDRAAYDVGGFGREPREDGDHVESNFARDLERRLRHANALIGKLRADTDCGDFDNDDLAQRLANIEETLTP